MKVAIFYDKSKPSVDLVYATTHKTEIELEKVILEIESTDNIVQKVHEYLGIEYVEPQSDCGPDGCE